ncbi:MAG: c-type cytochrome [Longimicrobiales bacterium]
MDRQRWKWMGLAASGVILVGGAGFIGFLYTGVYPIAADEPHTMFVGWMLTTLQENAVARRADDIRTPSLDEPRLLRIGAALYETECTVCHGAPGAARHLLGIGLNPDPPRLATEVQQWNDAELYWIIKHGLKMAGMPAFDAGHSEQDLWALTAVVRRLPTLTPGEWQMLVAASEGRAEVPEGYEWVRRGRGATITPVGDPERGRVLTASYGCGSCHVIPGVDNAGGTVGPPLTDFGERHYIAGSLLTTPENLTLWILSPESVEPGTAMPAVGVTPPDAWDIAAYLLSLGDRRLGPPHPLPLDWLPEHATVQSASAN